HGCQMPEQVLGRILRACSDAGDLMLDPFAGSGTTLAVAKKLGRRFVGFELSPEYAANAGRRLARIAPAGPLEGSATPYVQPVRQLGARGQGRPPRRAAKANGKAPGE